MKRELHIVLVITTLSMFSFGQDLPPEAPWTKPHSMHSHMDLPKPGYLDTIHDAMFGVDIIRISDELVFGKNDEAIQHQYSTVQAWNADMSLISIGFTTLLDASDYNLIGTLDIGVSMKDGRWSTVDPEIRYFCDGQFLKKVNVITRELNTLHEFRGYGSCTIGPWHGHISEGDRYVVVTSGDKREASVYDIKNDSVVSSKDFPETFDLATVTPWGDCVVVTDNATDKTEQYDLNFNYIRKLSDLQEHADFAVDCEGNHVWVEMCPIRMIRLCDGQDTDLLPATPYSSGTCGETGNNPWICGHVSGFNTLRPGWVLISAGQDDCNNSFPGYYARSEIFLLKLDGSGTIRHLGFSRSSYHDYLTEAKAVISPDGTKALFTSDWNYNGQGGHGQDYVVCINPEDEYSLTTSVTGNGSIVLTPPDGPYLEGTLIMARTIQDEDNIFRGWNGYLSDSGQPGYIRLRKNDTLSACFKALYLLSVNIEGNGSVQPAGGKYLEGTIKTITAQPEEGYSFTGWSGDTVSEKNPINIIINTNMAITAHFEPVTSTMKVNSAGERFMIYPNPVHSELYIRFSLDRPSFVELFVSDLQGRTITLLNNGFKQAGMHELVYDRNHLYGFNTENRDLVFCLVVEQEATLCKTVLLE